MNEAALIESLAVCQRRIEQLEARCTTMTEQLATLMAQIYCVEVESGAREHGRLGLEGRRYLHGTSQATLEGYRARVLAALTANAG